MMNICTKYGFAILIISGSMVDTDDTRRPMDDRRQTTPEVWQSSLKVSYKAERFNQEIIFGGGMELFIQTEGFRRQLIEMKKRSFQSKALYYNGNNLGNFCYKYHIDGGPTLPLTQLYQSSHTSTLFLTVIYLKSKTHLILFSSF